MNPDELVPTLYVAMLSLIRRRKLSDKAQHCYDTAVSVTRDPEVLNTLLKSPDFMNLVSVFSSAFQDSNPQLAIEAIDTRLRGEEVGKVFIRPENLEGWEEPNIEGVHTVCFTDDTSSEEDKEEPGDAELFDNEQHPLATKIPAFQVSQRRNSGSAGSPPLHCELQSSPILLAVIVLALLSSFAVSSISKESNSFIKLIFEHLSQLI